MAKSRNCFRLPRGTDGRDAGTMQAQIQSKKTQLGQMNTYKGHDPREMGMNAERTKESIES